MYSGIRSLPLDGSVEDYQGLFDATILTGDACLLLTTDPKPRLRWTAELHERFVDAVTQLGGPDKSQDTGSSITSSKMITKELNDGYQVTEALRVQMEVQRRLHEQIEVQLRLQLRIEAQSKYLQSILEKACRALNDQASASASLEAAREELSELAIKVSNDCQGMAPLDNIKLPFLPELAAALDNNATTSNMPARLGDCSVESCLTSTGSPVSQTRVTKKRQRPLFGNDDPLPLDDSFRQEIE